jgi:hypothetical protein
MPRPSQTERLDLLHGHDSLHDVLRSDDGEPRTDPTGPSPRRRELAVPIADDRPKDPPISDLCPLSF